MALATYAKLGGIPWLLKAAIGAHELVIGLGAAEVGEGRLGKRERFVGITTLFGGDGDYYLTNISKAVANRRYRDDAAEILRAAVLKVQAGNELAARRPGVLVFHAPSKDQCDEVQAVADLITEFGGYDVKHAFLEVNEHHPYMIFGHESKRSERISIQVAAKGVYAPYQGTTICSLHSGDVVISYRA